MNGAGRKLFVVADDLRAHRAGRVTAWARGNAGWIEPFHLPPCAPEHDPDEFPDSDVKQAVAGAGCPGTRPR